MGIRNYPLHNGDGRTTFHRYLVIQFTILQLFRLPVLMRKVATADYNKGSPNWFKLSEEARHLIERLLCVDPNERISSLEALEHPWLKA